MKSCIRNQQITLAVLALLILSGCVTSPTDNRERTSGPVIPAASPSPSTAPDVANTPLTLPVLDALLNDQEFVASLKSQLGLSEDQIASLKSLAAAEVERLRKTNAENSEDDATGVRSEAVRRVSEIIGQEKTQQLSALINEHWAKSGDQDATNKNTSMLDKPSAIPTDTRIVVNISSLSHGSV